MLSIALTGGIGAGKSLVAEMFAELGAICIDSDQLAREVIERGKPGFDEVKLIAQSWLQLFFKM
jgi:dephospho-CoA kinase